MKKVLLDLNPMKTKELIQEYLKFQMDFPDSYGGSLEALLESLTQLRADTCVGIFFPEEEPAVGLKEYYRLLRQAFRDAEEENEHLCVFFNQIEENYEN